MGKYMFKRIVLAIPILFGVSFLVFLVVYFIPGDPAVKILGQGATKEAVAQLRQNLGLNEPFFVQYGSWLWNMIHGNFGTSIVMRIPVSSVLFPKMINTIILAAGGFVISVVGGLLIGLLAGVKQNSIFDRISMFLAQFGANVPVFWLAIMLMWLFSLKLGWLPATGMNDLRNQGDPLNVIQHLVLPAIAASSVSLAIIARLARSSIIEVLNTDYITTYRAYGFPEWKIILKHGIRNIMSPLINIIGLELGFLLGGTLFVEVVFSWPGVGMQLYNSITAQDIPMIQTGVLFIAVCFVLINLINDLIISLLNPRLRN
jgi:ABC-type dipeptide/oligopeptide/nickel transport systems, permease components